MKIKARSISYHIERYQETSDLPDLVLLHGFMGSGRIFEHLIEQLSRFCNPITIDLLGHGETEGAELHYQFSTNEQVTGLAHIFKSLFDHPFFLYGYSMGGRLALQYALISSKRLNGLILESTTFGIENEQERTARQALDAERADSIMGNYEAFLKEWIELPLFRGSNSNSNTESIQKKQNSLWMANSLLGFGTGTMPCVKDALPNISSPTLLLAGERDLKFCGINSSMHKSISPSTFSIIPNSGHRIHLDNPESIIESIKTFIENHYTP